MTYKTHPKHGLVFPCASHSERCVVTREKNAKQPSPLAVQKAQYEEVTLNLRERNWKAVVNGDFFQPSFHLFNNEVRCTATRKLVIIITCDTDVEVKYASQQVPRTGIQASYTFVHWHLLISTFRYTYKDKLHKLDAVRTKTSLSKIIISVPLCLEVRS